MVAQFIKKNPVVAQLLTKKNPVVAQLLKKKNPVVTQILKKNPVVTQLFNNPCGHSALKKRTLWWLIF